MRIRSSVLALFLLAFACSVKQPRVPTRPMAKSPTTQFEMSPEKPIAGENHFLVDLRDSDGRPIADAAAGLSYDMPAMGSMAEMKGKAEVSSPEPGRYDLAYQLPMPGDWTLTLSIQAPGQPPQVRTFDVSTSRKGFVPEAGAGAETATGAVRGKMLEVPPGRQQLIGLTYAQVEERLLSLPLRAFGRVEVDERRLADVTLKFDAYATRLFIAETGTQVAAGTPLLEVYSPDLLAAEQEFLTASGPGTPGELTQAAERRLQLWGLTPGQLRDLRQRTRATGVVTIRAPVTGTILEKAVVEGSHVAAGMILYRLGNLGRIWVEAELYERDAPVVGVGTTVRISFPSLNNQEQTGQVSFVAPVVDPRTRTLTARIELANANLALKPGMFADVRLDEDLGRRLSVPDSALLRSGEHRYAFVERAPGRLQPVEVQVGVSTGDYDEVKNGLEAGDRVALGAAFLLSSEAQLREALPRWGAP